MSRYPYEMHRACWTSHVRDWPIHAKVWKAWGAMGWRPGIVVAHRRTRVTVRITDGRWPFVPAGECVVTHCAPNTLRARRSDEKRPTERATAVPSCLTVSGASHEHRPLDATVAEIATGLHGKRASR